MKNALLKAIWFTPGPNGRWGIPLDVEGRPGTGKSSTIASLAKQCGLHCETVIASLREPSDFLGLAIPRGMKGEGGEAVTHVEYAPPTWALRAAKAKHAVVFLDEVNTAPPSVQAALLRVVLDGVVGDFQLPATVRFIAAQNSVDEAAGGWDLAAPLANRFGHLAWETPSPDSWGDWLLGADADEVAPLDAAALEARVMSAWPSPFAKAKGLVAGFVKRRSELLLKAPNAGDPSASKAWPSPRTWEMATRALAGAEVHGLGEAEGDELLSAFVGAAAAAELAKWRTEADLPDPADVLDGKVEFTHNRKRLDRTAAVLGSCAALVSPQNAHRRNERAAALWKIITPIVEEAADLAVPAAKALAKNRLATVQEARKPLAKLQPILVAAGIQAGSI